VRTNPPKPCGIIETAVLALLIGFISGIPLVTLEVLWTGGKLLDRQAILSNGPMLSLAQLLSTVVMVPVLAWVARSRGWQAADYLGWIVPKRRDAAVALAVTLGVYVALVLAFDALDYLRNRSDLGSSFTINAYRSAREAGGLVTMWIAFVVAAPLQEELLFRGFLYRGWARSPRAAVPAVAVISALWAIAHLQYDWLLILYVFLYSLMLGWARWYSGSTVLTFAIHALTNASALVLTTWKLSSAHLIG